MLSRREWIRVSMLGAAGAVVTRSIPLRAMAPIPIDVYKTAACACCKAWVAHLDSNGFAAIVHDVPKLDPINAELGIPLPLQTCHAARVASYVISGHVPADLIQRFLREHPTTLVGLAVPGMPLGSPGMESQKKVLYSVLSFEKDGTTHVYARR